MRRWIRIAATAGLLTLASCGDTGAGSGQATLTCDGNDNLSRLWGTFARGEILTFLEPPLPGLGWVLFTHPTQALLGFLHPPDWGGTPITGGSNVGVDLLRGDGGGFYHNFTSFDATSSIQVGQWLDESVNRGLALMAASGNRTEICALPVQNVPNAGGGIQQVTATVIRTADTVLLSAVSLTFFDGLAGNGVAVQSYGGRTGEFNQIADQVFFPVVNQLLIPTGNEDRDTDLDGVIDRLDEFPLDPTRQ